MSASRQPTSATVSDRARGAMYGVALGDAMGMPGELWSRARVVRHFGWIDTFLPAPEGHHIVDGFVAGQVTDDTQQMIMLAHSIVRAGGRVDLDTLASDFVAWADRVGASEGHFLGPSSAKVLTRLRAGASPDSTGVAGITNGAAMRIAPVGVLCPSTDLAALLAEVETSCRLAHHTSIAIAGAAMVAGVVSVGLDAAESGSVDDTIAHAMSVALEVGMRSAVLGRDEPGPSLVRRAEIGIAAARDIPDDTEFLQFIYDVVGANTDATESVPAALALVVRGRANPLKVTTFAANLGGDTDTIGAMAGGMAGAISGFASIPASLVERLHEVNDLPIDELAQQLLVFRLGRTTAIPVG